jgi:cytochrome b561
MLPIKNTPERYGIITQLFHWVIAGIIIFNYYLVYRRDYIPETNPDNLAYILLHKALGVVVIILGVLFIIWRLTNTKPLLPTSTPNYERILAKSTHHLLLVLILLMPITGVLMSVFGGRPIGVFGLFTIPALTVANKEWQTIFYTLHEWLSFIIMGMVSIHVIGALKHQFFYKDNVLRRMLPVKLK